MSNIPNENISWAFNVTYIIGLTKLRLDNAIDKKTIINDIILVRKGLQGFITVLSDVNEYVNRDIIDKNIDIMFISLEKAGRYLTHDQLNSIVLACIENLKNDIILYHELYTVVSSDIETVDMSTQCCIKNYIACADQYNTVVDGVYVKIDNDDKKPNHYLSVLALSIAPVVLYGVYKIIILSMI